MRTLCCAVALLPLLGCATAGGGPAARKEGLRLRCGVAALGAVNPLDRLDDLAAWGFDYAEPALAPIAALDDAAFEALRRKAAASPIPVEASNNFVPAEIRLTGPEVDPERVRAYVERALGRAEALGVKLVVFGSGGARRVPEGFPRERAREQLKGFLRVCAGVITRRGYGMDIGVETLRRAETNILNTVAESLALVREVDHPRIRLTVDFYHLAEENDDPDVLLEAGARVAHLHFANPRGRVFPRDAGEEPRYAPFFIALRRIGYGGRISLEAGTADLERDARAGLRFLRETAERYR